MRIHTPISVCNILYSLEKNSDLNEVYLGIGRLNNQSNRLETLESPEKLRAFIKGILVGEIQ